ncbi:hypothetical protein C2G38_2195041 [Gigaspora rosea]|uniref:Uncharacterized protein n=1 Tax=Gigaspora rosea TaxID=44941 RepID=A0A397V3H4_9GLOM|nr:hypothetical protein C2G38_2195041 [Gigaspora rosea]
MPLLNIKSHIISIDDRKTPSTSKSTKLAYTISIKEHLSHVLNNSRLMAKMYFGRGVESQEKSELWHAESNYSDTQIKDALKISRLLSHNELEIYCSCDRSRRGCNELWMIEENYQIIPSNHVLRHVSI